MPDLLDPVTPGELLSEEFLKPLGLSQYRLAPLPLLRSHRWLLASRPRGLRSGNHPAQARARTQANPSLQPSGLFVEIQFSAPTP